jgi:hypothetical protein
VNSGLTARAALEAIKEAHRQQSASIDNSKASATSGSVITTGHAAEGHKAAKLNVVAETGSRCQSAATGSLVTGSESAARSATSGISGGRGQLFADVGMYRGVVAALKHVNRTHFQLTKRAMLEFVQVGQSTDEMSLRGVVFFFSAIDFIIGTSESAIFFQRVQSPGSMHEQRNQWRVTKISCMERRTIYT